MLLFRRAMPEIVVLAASCAPFAPVDAGRDAPTYDTHYDVIAPIDTHTTDAVDVLPTVDVVAFDVPAQTDASSDGVSPPIDSAVNPCTAIAEQYARAVRDAQTCFSSANCNTLVCETLCCNCQVSIDGLSPAATLITQLERLWETYACAATVTCTAYLCGGVAATECSSAGRCVTVHRAD